MVPACRPDCRWHGCCLGDGTISLSQAIQRSQERCHAGPLALAHHHGRQDIARTVMRLAVTGELVEHKGRFAPPQAEEPAED